jgi:hypothetical protein
VVNAHRADGRTVLVLHDADARAVNAAVQPSPISPPMATRLLGGQVRAFCVGQIVGKHGLKAGPAVLRARQSQEYP